MGELHGNNLDSDDTFMIEILANVTPKIQDELVQVLLHDTHDSPQLELSGPRQPPSN